MPPLLSSLDALAGGHSSTTTYAC
uniref:Uncharacterized protein n=1 Tax=Arundo donax TaxID=35708 RepID=A0A0A9BW09_ARUDO